MKNTNSPVLSDSQRHELIQRLNDHVISECSPVDMEQRFRDMIDECYSFDRVGGPFAGMTPSHVLEKMDPIAFRCGVSDHSDGEDVVDIEGNYYDSRRVEDAREEFVDGLKQALTDAESELSVETAYEDPDTSEIARLEALVKKIEAEIELAEDYAF